MRDQWVTHFGWDFTIFNTKVLKIEEFRNHDLLMISKGIELNWISSNLEIQPQDT